jgi:hypothetical protein
MTSLARIQEMLPGPYSLAPDAVLTQFLGGLALELEAFQEDLERMRRTHWINFVYRLTDAEKLAALVGVTRLPWEGLEMFRERLLPLVRARLNGAISPNEVRGFTYDYLSRAQEVLECTFVPGLSRKTLEQAFTSLLELRENPDRHRVSPTLQAQAGRVPYLFRWTETNRGLSDTVVTYHITGLLGGRTTSPVIVNLTTGELIGYAGRVAFGETLEIRPKSAEDRTATATLNGVDVTRRLYSVAGFELGVPFTRSDLDEKPIAPGLVRGDNELIFLSVGFYDLRGLSRFFFAMAGKDLREGVFDETFFDKALFPSGTVAVLDMAWTETEPASFEVRVPHGVVVEPTLSAAAGATRPHEQVAAGLQDSIGQLHAAGVKAAGILVPFTERQRQKARVTLPWKVIDRERGPAGVTESMDLGGRFGESSLGGSRFE